MARIAALVVALVVGAGPPPAAGHAGPGVNGGGIEARATVEWAVARFAEAGLPLPTLSITVHDDAEGCAGHDGLYDRETHIDLCTISLLVVLHELAHAWERFSVSDDTRIALMDHLSAATWNDTTAPWRKRAAEVAANTIAWGLVDRPLTPAEVRRNGDVLRRYELLTGSPSPRLLEAHG